MLKYIIIFIIYCVDFLIAFINLRQTGQVDFIFLHFLMHIKQNSCLQQSKLTLFVTLLRQITHIELFDSIFQYFINPKNCSITKIIISFNLPEKNVKLGLCSN